MIGDDVDAVCRRVAAEKGMPVLPVHSEGFKGTKKDGYQAACAALFQLVGTGSTDGITPTSLNILGDFNIAGETWLIRSYYERLGVQVVATITGDGRVDDIRRAHGAALNVVQCSGSMTHLARMMQDTYGIPFLRVSYFGLEDMSKALYDVAEHFGDAALHGRAQALVRDEVSAILPDLRRYRKDLQGKRAAVYTGGAFKAFSLVRSLRTLGMKTVLAGSQTGNRDDYRLLRELCDEDTILVDDTNPLELAKFVQEKGVDLLIGGVKERPIAYKLGIGFCDHNHERKIGLAGFEGLRQFAREVHATVMSPVWKLVPRRRAAQVRETPSPVAAAAKIRGTVFQTVLAGLKIRPTLKATHPCRPVKRLRHVPPTRMRPTAGRGGTSHDPGHGNPAGRAFVRGHAKCLQTLHAAGCLPGLCRRRGGAHDPARLAGLCHLHPPLHDQPLQGADRHRLVEFLGKRDDLRRP